MSSTTTSSVYDGLIHDDPGLLQLKNVPYIMTLEDEKALLEDARSRRSKLLENDLQEGEWYSRVSYSGVKVTSRKDEDNPFCMTKGVTDAPEGMTVDHVFQQFSKDFSNNDFVLRAFNRVDPMNRHMTIVGEVQHKELYEGDERLILMWGAYYVNPFVSDRDFIYVNHISTTACPVTQKRVFCSNNFSIPLDSVAPDMYSTTGRVRGEVQLTGYIFRPKAADDDDTKLSMTFVGQCDPKGYLPATIVNFVSVSQSMNVGRIRDSYIHFWDVLHNHMQYTSYVPVCCYYMPRRGGGACHKVVVDNNNHNNTHVRLLAHCDHAVSVVFLADSFPGTVEQGPKDEMAAQLLQGDAVEFGGKNNFLLDITLQVTMPPPDDNNNNSTEKKELCLEFVFTNHGWRKATLCIPSKTDVKKEDATAVEQ